MKPPNMSNSQLPYQKWQRYAHAVYWKYWWDKKGQQLRKLRNGQYRLLKSVKSARDLAIQHFHNGEPEHAISLYVEAVKRYVEHINEPQKSILLTGPVRIGKSTTARAVAQSGGYFHAEIDHFLFDRAQQVDREYLVKFGRDLCLALIRNFPDGVLIDAAYEQAASDVMSREFILRIKDEILIFLAGCGAEDPEARMAAIMEYRRLRSCWTNLEASTLEAVQQLTESIYQTSLLLKDFSMEHDLVYLPIGTESPEADIYEAKKEILSAVASR